MARHEEAQLLTAHNRYALALGLLMAQHHLTDHEADTLIKQTATLQRRRVLEIAEDILNGHAVHTSLRQMAHHLLQPSGPPPT